MFGGRAIKNFITRKGRVVLEELFWKSCLGRVVFLHLKFWTFSWLTVTARRNAATKGDSVADEICEKLPSVLVLVETEPRLGSVSTRHLLLIR